jgi:ATP-binding cassette subfamily B protein
VELEGAPTMRPRRKLRRLLPYFRPYAWKAVAAVVLMILLTATTLAIPALTQVAIDDGVQAGDRRVLYLVVVAFVVVGLIGWGAGYLQSFLSRWVGERVLLDLRTDTFRHAMRLELGYHERVPAGHTVSRLTSDIEALTQLVTDGVSSLVVNGLTFIGVVVILFLYDWQLALLAFTIFPFLAVGTALFRHYSTIAYRRTRERVADVLSNLQEALSGMRVVQGFGRQQAAAQRFAEANERYRRANLETIKLSGAYFPGVELLAGLGTLVVVYFGALQVLDGDLTLGVMIAFIGYLASFFDPIQQLSQLYNTFQAAMAALEKIFGVMDTEPQLDDAPGAAELGAVRGEVELRGVSFGYTRQYVLRSVDLHIAAGETVALVGATGAGKSTLAKLVARFYDPDEGAVLIDGRDLREVTQSSLRAQVGVVPQEGYLFSGTLRPPGGGGGRDPRGLRGGGRAGLHRGPAGRLRHRDHRARLQPVGRPAPADRLRPSDDRRPSPADPRRGHLVGRPPGRGAHRARARHPLRGQDLDRDRAPPLDRAQGRPDRRPRAWRDRRDRHPRGPDGGPGPLRPPLRRLGSGRLTRAPGARPRRPERAVRKTRARSAPAPRERVCARSPRPAPRADDGNAARFAHPTSGA